MRRVLLKTMENFSNISRNARLKKRWSFTRGSIYRAFTGEILVFGYSTVVALTGEVVIYENWSP